MDVDARVDWAYFRRSIVNGGGYWEPPQITIYVGGSMATIPLEDIFKAWEDYQQKLKDGS